MKIRISELSAGYWQATIDDEPSNQVVERSPDQALASLVRANIRRLGIESIEYLTEAVPVAPSGSDAVTGSTLGFGAAEPPIARPESPRGETGG